jgi:hypothetical protein
MYGAYTSQPQGVEREHTWGPVLLYINKFEQEFS